MAARSLPILIVLFGLPHIMFAQDPPAALYRATAFPGKFIEHINKKAAALDADLDRQTAKYLQRFLKKEKKLKRKIQKQDSATAAELFADIDKQYESPASAVRGKLQYMPHFDTLKTSLSFLEHNPDFMQEGKEMKEKIQGSLRQVKELQSRLQDAEQVKTFIRQRRDQIKQTLSKYVTLPKSLTKAYTDFNKELYYYSRQVQEYKDILNDPDKLTRNALDLLSKTSLFREFMSKHSELAALFPMPDNYGTPQALAGLQTRMQVQQAIQTQLAGAGPNAQQVMQQNLQAAQQQLSTLKDKIDKLGGSGGDVDIDMPDFKPNNQRTKSFLQRLEIGTNLQSTKSNYFFPTTTDMGLSVGYKLSDRSIIGIGGSYKIGWGKDIRNIVITSQGAALRSFLDVKLKGSIFLSGGFEYNYQPASVAPGNNVDAQNLTWAQSGLLGISKIVSMKTKFFKKTKVQLLYDFLSRQQEPKRQALLFRLGYNFK